MHFIEHIIEPTELLLAWQTSDEKKNRTRFIVGELNSSNDKINLTYLSKTNDFIEAQELGFKLYPAFQDINKVHHDVLDAFMRRLPPRTRGDFPQYLEGLRLRLNTQISDFALLGYSGAKLLSDGFSIIHPFTNVDGPCELLIEATGYRHITKHENPTININSAASFSIEEVNAFTQKPAIRIEVNGNLIGYVTRGLIPTFIDWIKNRRIIVAWIEKKNGTQGKPAVYLFVEVSSK